MRISKSESLYLIKIILVWACVNMAFNLFGLWITKLMSPAGTTLLENIADEFIKPLAIQSFVFAVCLTTGYAFLKNKKIAFYSFVLFQFVVFHLIFFLNLKFNNALFFVSTITNPGLKYLGYSGQYLVDVLYQYVPIKGDYDNGLFMPLNIGKFYFHWILLNLVYYFGVTWIARSILRIFSKEPGSIDITE